MIGSIKILVVSDIHYAGPAERNRPNYELDALSNRWSRTLVGAYRRWFWMRDPFAHNAMLDRALSIPEPVDFVVANGDFSCDSAFVGVSDPAARESAAICLQKLRERFGGRFRATIGDHELGKVSLAGNQGGMRFDSWRRALRDLRLQPVWKHRIGAYHLIGLTSSLFALPVFLPEILPEERPLWEEAREHARFELIEAFDEVPAGGRILLFLHDPTALPFLWNEPSVRSKAAQIEKTVIGHLHSRVIYWAGRMLAGMPVISGMGAAARRISSALHQAKVWKRFSVMLCPSLSGIELFKAGGVQLLHLDPSAVRPIRSRVHRLPRRTPDKSAGGE